jgi:hypothetical protein
LICLFVKITFDFTYIYSIILNYLKRTG